MKLATLPQQKKYLFWQNQQSIFQVFEMPGVVTFEVKKNVKVSLSLVLFSLNQNLKANFILQTDSKLSLNLIILQKEAKLNLQNQILQNSKSNLDQKIFVVGSSLGNISLQNLVKNQPNSQKIVTSQQIKSLSLSSDFTLQIQPILKISTPKIVASHGFSSQNFKPIQTEFLKSRGISKPQIQTLILNSFLNLALLESANLCDLKELKTNIINKYISKV